MAKRQSSRGRKANGARKSLWRRAGKWTATLAVWGLIVALFGAGWLYVDMPDFRDSLAPSRKPTVWILAADGTELAAVGDLYGIPIRLGDVPASLPQAVLATEDRRFYSHFGVDVIGLGRAVVANVRAGRIVQGGSTITQQVAKNLFLTSDRTFKRKLQEVMVALWLERQFSKDQILELYLNRVYLGAGTYGVDAAARKYFGISASDLTVWQSAMIAGLLKAPSRFNPHASQDRADGRTRVVLSNMVAAGYLTETEAQQARAIKSRGGTVRPGRTAPYFVDWVLDQVRDFAGAPDRDLIVKTTLDRAVQKTSETRLRSVLGEVGAKRQIGNGAALVMTPGGAVTAMVGGRDYGRSQFNRAVQAKRQPGSAFKPVIYLAGLQAGMSPSDMIDDAPIKIGDWQPRNFDGKYAGPVTMADGLARSINTVAVRIALETGMDRITKTARTLGIDPGDAPDASVALGTGDASLLDMVSAYAPFANGGQGIIPYGITEIRDGGGTILYQRSGSGPGQTVSSENVGRMSAMLRRVIESGTGRKAALGRPAAGKTGTSQNYRDAWFVGYTRDYVAGVWLGNDDGRPMKGVTGGSYPAVIWKDVMIAAHRSQPVRELPIERVPVASSGGRDSASDGNFFERLFSTLKEAGERYETEKKANE